MAYIIAIAAGLAADSYSLPYVACWSGGDTAVVRSTAERVIGCAREMPSGIGVEEADNAAA